MERKRISGKETKRGERRKYLRYACRTSLKTILDFNPTGADRDALKAQQITFSKGEEGSVLNISERGMAIELSHLLPAGLMLKIAIESPVTPPIETDARVVWADRLTTAKRGYIVGMSFRHMKDKHRRNLLRLIKFIQDIPE